MATRKKKTLLVGTFSGLRDDVASASKPENYADVFQNWRLDTHGALKLRRGLAGGFQKRFAGNILSLFSADTDLGPCVMCQFGSSGIIAAMPVGTVYLTASGSVKEFLHVNAQDEVEENQSFNTLYGPSTVYLTVNTATWLGSAGSGYLADIYMTRASGSYGSGSITQGNSHVVGMEFFVDGKLNDSFVYGDRGSYMSEAFHTSVPPGSGYGQFRFVYANGAYGALSDKQTIPF
jgi:hypothetical protein